MRTESDNLETGSEEKVKSLLSSLPRVEPPGDFDVRVRARIASAGVSGRTKGPLIWAKLAVPALAAVALAAVFFGGIYREDVREQVQVPAASVSEPNDTAPKNEMTAELPQPEVRADESAETALAVKEQPVSRTASDRVPHVSSKRTDATRRAAVRNAKSDEEGGAFEEAGRAGSRILPRGFESANEVRPDSGVPEPATSVSIADILSILGVDADRKPEGWLVRSVHTGSVAEKSGIRAGDVVEAIDETDIRVMTELKSRFDGSSLRVNREGKTLRLPISPK
jgi:membrane-associated protease RseP (regulator of RpoE activity)